MKVQEVKYLSDYTISIKFEDGVSGTIQLNDLVQKASLQSQLYGMLKKRVYQEMALSQRKQN